MDPRKFHDIDENLTSSDVAQLKFLCLDLIPKKRLETVEDAKDLFLRLDEQALLDDELLIPELLITIGRLDLLGILETTKEEVDRKLPERDISSKCVSAYRKMLLSLSEDMTEENLRSVRFLLDLPRAKVGPSASFLDVMIEMEKQQKLGEDNLVELYGILEKCDKQLANRIVEFEDMYIDPEKGSRLPLQDVSNNGLPSNQIERERADGRRRCSSVVADSVIQFTSDEYYTMTQRPLGYCLIINNYNFEETPSFRNRKGTEKDKDDLARLFTRMHFIVEVRDDLSASEIRNVMREFAEKNHTQMGAFVCCVLSHGEKGTVFGTDGNQIEIRALTQPFAECRTLAEKPKLFFIQACQGKESQKGVWVEDGQANDREEKRREGFEEDARIPTFHTVPLKADFLIGMATVEDYRSYRHITEGSIYIQELCRQLEICCPRKEDILSILIKVNREVSAKVLKGHKQMPEPRYTLTKKLVLPID